MEVARTGAPRRTFFVAVLAVGAAALGFALAPDAWPTGEGVLRLSHRGAEVISTAVQIGDDAPVLARGSSQGNRYVVELPGGVPVNAPTRAAVSISAEGEAIRPEPGTVSLSISLPGGAIEVVPALRWDPGTGATTAERRPPVGARVILALLGAVIVLWVSEVVPLFATALLIPIVLAISGAGAARDVLAPFFDPIIALFFAGFLLAEAVKRVRLDEWASVSIVARAGRSPARLFVVMLLVAAFLSMWMSNTGAVAVLLPIALAVTAPLQSPSYRRAMVLGIAYAATIGGVGSAIGTPANPLAIEFLSSFTGEQISFVGWFAYGLPVVAVLLPVMGFYLWRRFDVTVNAERFEAVRVAAGRELARVGRPTRDQAVVLAVTAGVMALWLTQTWHGIETGIAALAGAVVLVALGKVRQGDLGAISWNALITFGGGLTLGLFLVESGSADWIATRLTGSFGVPSFVGVAAVAGATLILTAAASNTASAAMLIPLAIPVAGVIGVDPVLMVMVVAVASSLDFALVIGTPPTMLAYSTRLFTSREIFRVGMWLDLAGLVLLVTLVLALWDALGLT